MLSPVAIAMMMMMAIEAAGAISIIAMMTIMILERPLKYVSSVPHMSSFPRTSLPYSTPIHHHVKMPTHNERP